MADPLERASDEVCVVPSTAIANVPVGVPIAELDADATVIVMVSLAPEEGVAFAPESVVIDPAREEEPVVGHAFSRL